MEKEELIRRYGIDVNKLKKEQGKLARQLEVKDKIDFNLADKFAAVDTTFIGNKILCSVIVCDKDLEILDRAYVLEKTKFPYLAGYRAYRELPAMVLAFEKLNVKPDVVFVPGQGIIHPRLGLASHFSLAIGVPIIGISSSVLDCNVEGENIIKDGKKIGRVLVSKPGSRPMYISPGNQISVKTSYELSKNFIRLPHKLPEPLHLAGKYGREIKKELGI